MSKFLDETGLAYFWGKIKDYVSSHGAGLPNGGTTGQYLKKNSSADQDADWANFPTIPSKVSDLTNDSNFITGMEILSYGKSTWNDFITAYNAKKVVYCRASSNSNPASGSQTRLAFMAYVNDASNPANVEFQYYRSVNSHSNSQQGDQVYVYKLTSAGTWTVTVRENYTKIVAGTGLSGSYNSGVLTLTNDVDAATATPENLGTAAVGSSSKFAREDHVHNKPTYTKSDIGLENVDNIQQYSASNPPPDEIHIGPSAPSDPDAHVWIDTDETYDDAVLSFNGQTGDITYDPYSPITSGEVAMATDVTQPSGWHQYWQRFGRLVFVDIYIMNETESNFADDKQLATGFPAPLGSHARVAGDSGWRPISAEIDSNGNLHLQWSGWINAGDGARFYGWYIAAT